VIAALLIGQRKYKRLQVGNWLLVFNIFCDFRVFSPEMVFVIGPGRHISHPFLAIQ
jgi:hypothetical protein